MSPNHPVTRALSRFQRKGHRDSGRVGEGGDLADSGDSRQETEALGKRVSALNEAVLRISLTLDLDAVLAEAVDSARGLSGARFGAVVTVDETGARQNYVLSGFAPSKSWRRASGPTATTCSSGSASLAVA